MAFTGESDEQLFERYRRGEVKAFETLYERHKRAVFRFACRYLGSEGLAEDVMQDVFIKIVRNAAAWEGRSSFTTWMYAITRNQCLDEQRKLAHRRHASLDAPADGDPEGRTLHELTADQQPGAERDSSAREAMERVRQAIANLPEEQREVFVLRQTANIKFKDIAAMLDIPENTVKSRMRYALESIRAELDRHGFRWEDFMV
ncbi:MAG: ECF RNA polymerase sigma factor SigW [Myxococcota bacterium]|nr:ECF RNA polymerase sigma factor SigW [Myxococcota bacterium]